MYRSQYLALNYRAPNCLCCNCLIIRISSDYLKSFSIIGSHFLTTKNIDLYMQNPNKEENSKIYNCTNYVNNYFFYLISETQLRNHILNHRNPLHTPTLLPKNLEDRIKQMKQRFSDIGQQASQNCDPQEKGNGILTITLSSFLKALLNLVQKGGYETEHSGLVS